FGPEFHGAQVYALSKTQLVAGGPVNMTQFDTHGLDTFGFALNGFTLWPSVTPVSGGYGGGDSASGGTEYFLSTNGGAEAHDTGMQQVTWVNGSLWGANDTGLNISSAKQAGIEWFKVTANGGSTGAALAGSGYVGLGNDNLTYPAIGITTSGTGVMAFTVVGNDFYPSAGYATISGSGISDIHIAAAGQGPDDGFTNYRLFAIPT